MSKKLFDLSPDGKWRLSYDEHQWIIENRSTKPAKRGGCISPMCLRGRYPPISRASAMCVQLGLFEDLSVIVKTRVDSRPLVGSSVTRSSSPRPRADCQGRSASASGPDTASLGASVLYCTASGTRRGQPVTPRSSATRLFPAVHSISSSTA